MSKVHYSTCNGALGGRASPFYRDEVKANSIADEQNEKSKGLNLSVQYGVESCDESEVEDRKQIR